MLDYLSDDALLAHNREVARRLVRWKRYVLLALVLMGLPVVFLAPSGIVHYAWALLLGLAIVAVVIIEPGSCIGD